MTNEEPDVDYLEQYLLLCRQIYERHVHEGTWPTEEQWESWEKSGRSGSPTDI